MVHQLQVDGDHGLLGEAGGVHVGEEEGGDLKPRLRPHHVEIRTELDTVLLNIQSLIKNVQSRPKYIGQNTNGRGHLEKKVCEIHTLASDTFFLLSDPFPKHCVRLIFAKNVVLCCILAPACNIQLQLVTDTFI